MLFSLGLAKTTCDSYWMIEMKLRKVDDHHLLFDSIMNMDLFRFCLTSENRLR